MVEEREGGGGALMSVPGRLPGPSSTWVDTGSLPRQRFHVEFNGDSCTVSWRKLLKSSAAEGAAPPGAKPGLEARIAPEISAAAAGMPAPSKEGRMNSVIEKIERLYKGVDSDEEVEAGDVGVPDDEQYNTDDSFIDDAELDEYFTVDKAKTKHTGFFVNKGTIESLNETATPVPVFNDSGIKIWKRKKKEQDGPPNKYVRRIKTGARKPVAGGDLALTVVPSTEIGETRKAIVLEDRLLVEAQSNKATKISSLSSPGKEIQKTKHILEGGKEPPAKLLMEERINSLNVLADSSKLRNSNCGITTEITTGAKVFRPALPSSKEVSPGRKGGGPKGTILDRAFQELEKGVAEFCPATADKQEADNAGQKPKRLPREVKIRLAKVARLVQAKQGKISDDCLERLMKTLGHVMQLKTLKRNLKEMIELGISAKKEKQGRLENIKREIIEMVKSRISSQQAAQDTTERQATGVPDCEGRYKWDNATEDRICDLYELYLEGMDEHRGAPSRKFYAELAELWPEGWMDNNGIKSAVLRAKERRKGAMKQARVEERKRKKLYEASPKNAEGGANPSGAGRQAIAMGRVIACSNRESSKDVKAGAVDHHVNASSRKPVPFLEEQSKKVDDAEARLSRIVSSRKEVVGGGGGGGRSDSGEGILSNSLRKIKKNLNKAGKEMPAGASPPAGSLDCFASSLNWRHPLTSEDVLGRNSLPPEPC